MFAYPLCQPNHRQALAAALGVPDDAALAALHVLLGRPDAEVLIMAAGLFRPCVKDDEIMHDLQQAVFAADLAQLPQQRVVASGRVGLGFLPA